MGQRPESAAWVSKGPGSGDSQSGSRVPLASPAGSVMERQGRVDQLTGPLPQRGFIFALHRLSPCPTSVRGHVFLAETQKPRRELSLARERLCRSP